jgi:phospholipase C
LALAGGSAAAIGGAGRAAVMALATKTPIQHLVVIFDENVSFDHYFGTYPYALNPKGEPSFVAKAGTPAVNGMANDDTTAGPTGPLLDHNGNESNPLRLGPADAMTCDQDHAYAAEQLAADHGAEDMYVQNTGHSLTLAQCLNQENAGLTHPSPIPTGAKTNYAVMDYYDGNTVTALWNYAQHFAMSDNNYGTTYGPSTLGALNVSASQTYGATCGPSSATINGSDCTAPPGYNSSNPAASKITTSPVTAADPTGTTSVADQPAAGPATVYNDSDPTYDICSYLPSTDGGDGNTPATTIAMGGNNIGEELDTAGLTWGWFEGGFDDGYVPGHGTAPKVAQICSEEHTDVGGKAVVDYVPHHEPFQYFASTANPMHLPPKSVANIGHSDQANHQYDIADFWAAADAGDLPAVSFLKAPAYEDGHAGYSDPLDEQQWLVNTVNSLEALKTWSSTAVIVTWDDSDGWYDQELAPIISGSQTSLDSLTGTDACGSAAIVPVNAAAEPEQGKCGLGPRLPFLVISPFAKSNYVDSNLIDQSSVDKFVEYNWALPALGDGAADAASGSLLSFFDFKTVNPALVLNPTTGEPVTSGTTRRQ